MRDDPAVATRTFGTNERDHGAVTDQQGMFTTKSARGACIARGRTARSVAKFRSERQSVFVAGRNGSVVSTLLAI
jgi:hypothetical protein